MKIKIWTAITDGGDGEHHSSTHKSLDDLLTQCGVVEIDAQYPGGSGYGFDEYGYIVNFSCSIFDTEGYEVVE